MSLKVLKLGCGSLTFARSWALALVLQRKKKIHYFSILQHHPVSYGTCRSLCVSFKANKILSLWTHHTYLPAIPWKISLIPLPWMLCSRSLLSQFPQLLQDWLYKVFLLSEALTVLFNSLTCPSPWTPDVCGPYCLLLYFMCMSNE